MEEKGKNCTKCKEYKTLDNYYFRKDYNKYRGDCKQCVSNTGKAYREANREKRKAQKRKYYLKNRERLIKETSQYKTNKRRTCRLSRTKYLVSKSLRRYITGGKSKRAKECIGCTWEELLIHLAGTFEANYGIPREYMKNFELHIDHIKPLASASSEEEIYELNHYTNLQYLMASDNLSKGSSSNWSI